MTKIFMLLALLTALVFIFGCSSTGEKGSVNPNPYYDSGHGKK